MPLTILRAMLRGGLVAVALLGMAACQQPATDGSGVSKPSATAGSSSSEFKFKDNGGKHYFADEEAELRKELVRRMVDACFKAMPDKAKLDSCFRDRFADAFDDSGKGRTGCAHYSDTDQFSECLAAGNTVLDIRRRLKDSTPISAGFWSDPDEMVKAFTISILTQGAESCGANKSDAAAMDCLDHWLTDKLEMPSDLMERCPNGLDTPERQACFGQAIGFRYLRDHVSRISGLGA